MAEAAAKKTDLARGHFEEKPLVHQIACEQTASSPFRMLKTGGISSGNVSMIAVRSLSNQPLGKTQTAFSCCRKC